MEEKVIGGLISLINEETPHLYYCTYSKQCIGIIQNNLEYLMLDEDVQIIDNACNHQHKCFNFDCKYNIAKKIDAGDKEFTEEELTKARNNLKKYTQFYQGDEQIAGILRDGESGATVFTRMTFKREE